MGGTIAYDFLATVIRIGQPYTGLWGIHVGAENYMSRAADTSLHPVELVEWM